MVKYEKFVLDNGLTVILHVDESTPMVAVNVLYKVGSKDEDPGKTGFTHLFEHLMFSGTENVPDFDTPIQLAGGENNAFTNNDITNFYNVLPKENLEVALWLEADRLAKMKFTPKALRTQKKVVIEEFKESCLNEPYGDMWHHLSAMMYPDHGYHWPTIGKEIAHISNAKMSDVEAFFYEHYRPSNAIISICGNIDTAYVKELVVKWFGDIEEKVLDNKRKFVFNYDSPEKSRVIIANVPSVATIQGFKMHSRCHPDYYTADLISDILSSGRSSRLYRRLIKEDELFSNVDAFITGTTDDGAFVIDGKVMEGVDPDKAIAAVWEELERLKTERIGEEELQKIKNKTESNLVFSETSILSKAMSLSYYEYLGDIELINSEAEMYDNITAEDIQRVANELFQLSREVRILYRPIVKEVEASAGEVAGSLA